MRSLLFPLVCGLLLMSGCVGNMIPKSGAFPEMYNEQPITILVVPAINFSTAANAPNLYASTINEPLSNAGFYVLPIELTNQLLRNEGLSQGEQLKDVPPQKFAKYFGADAVLYVTIRKWDTNYFIIGGNVTVGIKFDLKSTKTGLTLWAYKDQLVIDTSGDSNSGGLLGALIATALTTAAQDYVPIARSVNTMALRAIPFGKYHKMYRKDMDIKIPASKIQKKN